MKNITKTWATLAMALLFGVIVHAQKKNVLLICVDDLRPELNCYGVDYIHSPNIDALATQSRVFNSHYVNSPSCGPSRFTLLTGTYGDASNQALFIRKEAIAQNPEAFKPSMPRWFKDNGYTTVSVGKVSHHPGGWGGEDWSDKTDLEMPGAWSETYMPVGPWKDVHGAMHGTANGTTRSRKTTRPYESVEGDDTIYPDGLIADEGLVQLEKLAKEDKPFFLAIGLIKPHLPFACPKKYTKYYDGVELPAIPHPTKPEGQTTWHPSSEFFRQYLHEGKDPRVDAEYADIIRRHYAACVTYADKHIGDIMNKLKESGQYENTIVILWGDHGWNLGEHAIWGKHSLFEESLRAPLMISVPGMKSSGEMTDAVVETTDIFPTLCELTGLPSPDFTAGVSLTPQLEDPKAEGHVAYAYKSGKATLRTATHRITVHGKNYVELYDHTSPEKETKNIADAHPELVEELKKMIKEKGHSVKADKTNKAKKKDKKKKGKKDKKKDKKNELAKEVKETKEVEEVQETKVAIEDKMNKKEKRLKKRKDRKEKRKKEKLKE